MCEWCLSDPAASLPFLGCSRRSGGFWLATVLLVGLVTAAPAWLLCPTGAGRAGGGAMTDGTTGAGWSKVALLAKASSWGLVRPAGDKQITSI